MSKKNVLKRVWNFYYQGFKGMTLGRTLWAVILIKLFIMFAILRLFFFPDIFARLDSGEEKAGFMLEQLTDGQRH